MQFAKWGQAEAAMEAHNSKTRLGTSEVPLVVKFADAKRKEPSPHHVSPLSLTPKCWIPAHCNLEPQGSVSAMKQAPSVDAVLGMHIP